MTNYPTRPRNHPRHPAAPVILRPRNHPVILRPRNHPPVILRAAQRQRRIQTRTPATNR